MTTISADKLASVGGGKCFYTYMHTRKSDGKVFYVGKGKRGRAWSRDGRSAWWRRVAESHGFVVDVYARWESEADAFTHEIFLIETMRSLGQPLVNSTDGGEGVSGHKRTPEQIAAMVERRLEWFKTEAGLAAANKSSEIHRARMQDPEIKKRATSGLMRWLRDPKNRDVMVARARAARVIAMDPEIEARRIEACRKSEQETGSHSKRAKAQMQNKEFSDRFHAGRDAHFSVEENRRAVGDRMRAYYAIPENRERLVAANRARASNMDGRIAKSRAKGCGPFTHIETGVVYQTQGEAAKATGFSQGYISSILSGKKISFRGQHFIYNHNLNKE